MLTWSDLIWRSDTIKAHSVLQAELKPSWYKYLFSKFINVISVFTDQGWGIPFSRKENTLYFKINFKMEIFQSKKVEAWESIKLPQVLFQNKLKDLLDFKFPIKSNLFRTNLIFDIEHKSLRSTECSKNTWQAV